MRKLSVKNILILLISIIILGVVISSLYFILNKNDKDSVDNDTLFTGVIEKVDLTDEGEILENVKAHVVRITNTVGKHKIVGSGFFIEEGYLVTNSHVVDIKGDITIEYSDGTKSSATLVSNDITSDVAILKVNDIDALAMVFGNTLNVKIANDLYAVGYAANLDGESSITKGILSARRSMAGIEYLQTDAAINSGFSGGPLFNKNGEVVGMNSLANDNATIGMAISSESLQNIIEKLVKDNNVSYLESDRPTNALSSVLKEVGFDIDDLYYEWNYFHDGEKKPTVKEEEKRPYIASTNCEVSYIGVEGYDIGWEKRDEANKFKLNVKGNIDSVNVIVKPKDSKATYKVKGNKNLPFGYSTIYITVTAEDGIHKQDFWIITQRLNDRLEDLYMVKSDVSYGINPVTGVGTYSFYWQYLNSKGESALTEGNTDAIEKIEIDVYTCGAEYQCSADSQNSRFLKKYTFLPVNYEINTKFSDSEIKQMLTEEDYNVSNYASLYFKISIHTKHQGVFYSSNSGTVNK